MTLRNLIPWVRKEIPIRHLEGNGTAPTLWGDFDQPFGQVQRLFDRFVGLNESPFAGLIALDSEFVPSLDVHETDNEFQIKIEVPGMDEKDIKISMSRDVLTISGENKEQKEENVKGVHRMERRYGSFHKSIPLPENSVDTEKAEASYKNGVLTVRLPKTAECKAAPKQIPIVSNKAEEPKAGNGHSS
jgi:HSP20 family protein